MSHNNKQVFIALEALKMTGSETQTLVLGHISYHFAKHGYFNSSIAAIAKYLNYSTNAVKQALIGLQNVVDEKGNPLLFVEVLENYNRKIKLNSKHALGFDLIKAFIAMINKTSVSKNSINLYSVSLDDYSVKHRYESRHKHKMLILKALITTRILSNLHNTNNKTNTYKQAVRGLSKLLGWSYMTIVSLVNTLIDDGFIAAKKQVLGRVCGYIFSFITKSPTEEKPAHEVKAAQFDSDNDILDIPILRYQ